MVGMMADPDWYAEQLRLSAALVAANAEVRRLRTDYDALREIHAKLEAEAHALRAECAELRRIDTERPAWREVRPGDVFVHKGSGEEWFCQSITTEGHPFVGLVRCEIRRIDVDNIAAARARGGET